jgi:integrase
MLTAPDTSTWIGRRDRALLLVAVQTGLRVSELRSLLWEDVALGTGAHDRCAGKGRKQRCTRSARTPWRLSDPRLEPRDRRRARHPCLPSTRGGILSRDAVERLVTKHAQTAAHGCPSLKRKKVTPHTLRHSAAMSLFQHGVGRSVIALWLGHESVETSQIYLHADVRLKERALACTEPFATKAGRFRPSDDLLAFLKGL